MSHATLVPSTAPTRVDDLTFSIHTTPFDEDYTPAASTRATTNFANLARGADRRENLRAALAMIDGRLNDLAHPHRLDDVPQDVESLWRQGDLLPIRADQGGRLRQAVEEPADVEHLLEVRRRQHRVLVIHRRSHGTRLPAKTKNSQFPLASASPLRGAASTARVGERLLDDPDDDGQLCLVPRTVEHPLRAEVRVAMRFEPSELGQTDAALGRQDEVH